ncbi:MAG: phosphate ABC transporter permease PstA [Methyloligellaceae bacterium]
MVEITDKTSIHTSEAANKRLAKRYAFEARFKFFGMLSVTLAILALVVLLWTVFGKAAGVIKESYIALDVTFEESKVDPEGKRDPDHMGQQDLDILWKKALRAAFPNIKSRSDKNDLYTLLSNAAGLELRKAAIADTSLVGKTIRFELLADDEVDLYLKGYSGKVLAKEISGTASPSEVEDGVKIDVEKKIFGDVLEAIKTSLISRADILIRQSKRQLNAVQVYNAELKGLQASLEKAEAGSEVRTKIEARISEVQSKLDSAVSQKDNLLARAKALKDKANSPDQKGELTSELLSVLVYINGGVVKAKTVTPTSITGDVLFPLSSMDTAPDGKWGVKLNLLPEDSRKITDKKIVWIEKLKSEGRASTVYSSRFFTGTDSREPERAGVWNAVVGSFWTMLVTLILAFPIGVLAAIYLEEFAPKSGFFGKYVVGFIEVNINNLAAVPSIIFGLLGLAVFLAVMPDLRSAPLIGGIVLALMTLPTIIISARAAIKAVPPSIREAALGVGASKNQAIFHHVLPLAMPGILTGTIIGMAQALGETAPLLLIGMVAFIKDIPGSVLEPATVLPVQIFRWADFPERAFELKTAAAIVVLLLFLVAMNAIAIFLRQKFERKW